MKIKKILFSGILICFLFVISACAAPDTSVADADYSATAPDGESIPLMTSLDYQLIDEGYFIGGNTIKYYDFSEERSYVVCSQPGCVHKDVLCPAYLGDDGQYAVYGDIFYALISDYIDGAWCYTFQSRKSEDTAWKELWEHTFPQDTISNVAARLGNGHAVICVREEVLGEHAVSEYVQLVAIDLETGIVDKVMQRSEATNSESYLLSGVSEEKIVLLWTGFDEEILSGEEYVQQAVENGDTAEDAENAWYSYLEEHRMNRILTADLNSGEIEEVASGMNEKLLQLTYPDLVYRGILYYYDDGAIMTFSLSDGEVEELLRVPDVINVFARDGRVFYIISKNGEASYHYYVLESGECYELKNEQNKEGMVYSVHHENSTMFMGLYQGNWHLIDKEDYYKENYSKSIRVKGE